MAQVAVRGDERIESCLGRVEEGAVIECGPAHFMRGRDGVPSQRAPQGDGSALIEQNPHAQSLRARSRSRHCQATLGVLQHGLYLLARHTRKPLEEVIDARAVFEVLEEGLHRYARTSEEPFSADLAGQALHHRAVVPVEHERTIPPSCLSLQGLVPFQFSLLRAFGGNYRAQCSPIET